ncbi:MAG TPA: hypothetical protein VIM79_19140 [Niastella sp.]
MYKPLFCFAMAVSLMGCHPEENPDQLKAVNQSLERMNVSVSDDNNALMEILRNRQKDPQSAAVAEKWLPGGNKIHKYADSLRLMLDSIKSELITQSDSLKMDFVPVVRQLHNEDGVGIRLFGILAEFKDSIPAFISVPGQRNKSYLPKDIPFLNGYSDSLSANDKLQFGKEWLEKSFGRSSSLMAMIMLNKIENDVLMTEKMLIEYCNSQACYMPVIYDTQYKPLAVLSSSCVKKGQSIEVTAGIGEFTDAMKPRVTINDKEVKLDDGRAIHQFVADGKPGIHSVIVEIEFYKPDGSKAYVTKRLEYTIADEK